MTAPAVRAGLDVDRAVATITWACVTAPAVSVGDPTDRAVAVVEWFCVTAPAVSVGEPTARSAATTVVDVSVGAKIAVDRKRNI